jgi:uncharacterized membrane protein
MHRDLEITLPSEATDRLLSKLEAMDGVISLAVHRDSSVKPPGDVISAAVLNDDVDEVLEMVGVAEEQGSISVSTSSLDSLLDSDNREVVWGDVDEATWEEASTAVRRHSRPTINFFLTTIAGAIIVTCGLAASSGVTEATALVAAAIIAPAFEPLARIALGAVNRRPDTMLPGAGSALLSFVLLIVFSLVTMLVLRIAGHGYVDEFHHSLTVHEVEYPPLNNLIISAAGAVAGAVLISAGRFTQLAGPLVALQLLPAAACVGVALELGEGGLAARSFGRLAIDIGMVLLAALIVFAYKHVVTHGGRRAVH